MTKPSEEDTQILPERGSKEEEAQELKGAADRLVETGVGGTVIPPWNTEEK